jgi:hypothetical protein
MATLNFGPAHFIFASFASAFLLKVSHVVCKCHTCSHYNTPQLLRPDFAGIVGPAHKDHILSLVGRLIKVFASNNVAVDDRHTPKLYSRFLASLVARYSTPSEESHRAIPKIESSPVDTPMTSLPTLSMSSNQRPGQITQATQVAPMGSNQYGQTLTLSPTHYGDTYSSSSAGGTVTQYNMEQSMPEVPSEDLLASMQAINNPVWWEHVMMPGFTWPDSVANPSGSGDQSQQQHSVDPYNFVPHNSLMQHDQRMS